MTSYRVRYTEVKPGGHHAPQDEFLRDVERRDVVIFLSGRQVVAGSVSVTEYTKSDGQGVDLGGLGW